MKCLLTKNGNTIAQIDSGYDGDAERAFLFEWARRKSDWDEAIFSPSQRDGRHTFLWMAHQRADADLNRLRGTGTAVERRQRIVWAADLREDLLRFGHAASPEIVKGENAALQLMDEMKALCYA